MTNKSDDRRENSQGDNPTESLMSRVTKGAVQADIHAQSEGSLVV
jgi:hypothetical protein